MLISAGITILEDFGSLPPARTVTVNLLTPPSAKVPNILSDMILKHLSIPFNNMFLNYVGIGFKRKDGSVVDDPLMMMV